MQDSKQIAEAIAQHEAEYHTRPTRTNKSKVRPYSKEYKAFWAAFPKRYILRSNSWVKKHKSDGWEVWQNMTKEEQSLALSLVGNEKADQSTQDVHRWLKGRRWEDYMPEPEYEPLDVPQPNMKTVDKEESVSDKVNRQRRKLGVKQ